MTFVGVSHRRRRCAPMDSLPDTLLLLLAGLAAVALATVRSRRLARAHRSRDDAALGERARAA
jgi:hypothetical protein